MFEYSGIVEGGRFSQVALVVNNLEESKKLFAELLGVPVPETCDPGVFEVTHTEVMGEPAPLADCRMAFFKLTPGVDLELIEPNHEHSVWRDEIERLEEGLHHIAFRVDNADKVVEQLKEKYDAVVEQQGLYGDASGKYVYVSLHKTHHVRLELLENFND